MIYGLGRNFFTTVSGIKIPRYPTEGKIQHPARSLKPHCRGPGKTGPPKPLTACQLLEAWTTNSIPPEPCERVLGEMGISGGIFLPRLSPRDFIKAPDPSSYFRLTRGTCGTLWQDGEPRGPPKLQHPLPPMGRMWLCIANWSTRTTP
jgi:hypothetical protein